MEKEEQLKLLLGSDVVLISRILKQMEIFSGGVDGEDLRNFLGGSGGFSSAMDFLVASGFLFRYDDGFSQSYYRSPSFHERCLRLGDLS